MYLKALKGTDGGGRFSVTKEMDNGRGVARKKTRIQTGY